MDQSALPELMVPLLPGLLKSSIVWWKNRNDDLRRSIYGRMRFLGEYRGIPDQEMLAASR